MAHLEELENKIFHSKPNESEPASRDQSEDEISEKLNNNKNHSISNDGETKYEKNSSNVGSFGKLSRTFSLLLRPRELLLELIL